jgi:hypothetical protein
VTFTDAAAFLETGAIGFGAGHVLRFGAVGSGYLGPSANPTFKHGTVKWQVEGGEGQFDGASGLVTSNFFVGEDLAVTDYQTTARRALRPVAVRTLAPCRVGQRVKNGLKRLSHSRSHEIRRRKRL